MRNSISTLTHAHPRRAECLRQAFGPKQEAVGPAQHLSCEVVFGSPSANCMGTGVCKISARQAYPTLPRRRSCRSTVALMFPCEGGWGVSMVLVRELLCTQLVRTHLRRTAISLAEPCRLPREVVQRLGLKINVLRPGDYAIEELEGCYRINFR